MNIQYSLKAGLVMSPRFDNQSFGSGYHPFLHGGNPRKVAGSYTSRKQLVFGQDSQD